MTEIENLTTNLPATNAFTTPIKDQLKIAIHKFRTNTSQFNLSITEPDIAESANQIAKDFLTAQTISIAGTVNTIKQLITQIDALRKSTINEQDIEILTKFINNLADIYGQSFEKLDTVTNGVQFNVYTDKNNANDANRLRFDEDTIELQQAILALISDIFDPYNALFEINDSGYETIAINFLNNHNTSFISLAEKNHLADAFNNPETKEFINTIIAHPDSIITIL